MLYSRVEADDDNIHTTKVNKSVSIENKSSHKIIDNSRDEEIDGQTRHKICTDSKRVEDESKKNEILESEEDKIPIEIIDTIDYLKFDIDESDELTKIFEDDGESDTGDKTHQQK